MDTSYLTFVAPLFLMAVVFSLYIMRRRVRQGKRTAKF
jgi:preprotein translocase subunit YajC